MFGDPPVILDHDMTTSSAPAPVSVALVTLGCARNDVDSEELAGRLDLVEDPAEADTVVVNTCGFVESAKKDSVDTLLEAADLKDQGKAQAVVAVGCLAERYGKDLAASLPEADAVLGFDDYPDIAARLRSILAGETLHPHTPADRRKLLPITPADRLAVGEPVPGHDGVRRRLDDGPWAPLKLASGCDRRCSFCAIPSFRGSFVSRRPSDVVAEAAWLAGQGVREVFLVGENSTSDGKDLGDIRLLESLLPAVAEARPGLVQAIGSTPGVAAYFDLSFQHASPTVLRRMRRFGDAEAFLQLLERVRAVAPDAGVRSNVIVGFPGETEQEFDVLTDFLQQARLDVVGVFGYSDEEGTEAVGLPGHLPQDEVDERVSAVTRLVEELTSQRAEERVGTTVRVLVESVEPDGSADGRAAHQGPEVDGTTTLLPQPGRLPLVGDLVEAAVVGSVGVDLVAAPVPEGRS